VSHSETFTSWPECHAWLTRLSAWCKANTLQGRAVTVSAKQVKRTLPQNSLMWDILQAFADQKTWFVNGVECRITAEDWKDVLTAAFHQEVRMAQGLNGGIVMLGARTSRWDKPKMSEFIDFIQAAAAQHGVSVRVSTDTQPSA
jgi:hypothetical protein